MRKRRRESPASPRTAETSPPIPWRFVLQVRLYAWLFPIAFCAAAWIGLAVGLDERSLARDSKTWPTATGTITSATVDVSGGRFTVHYEPHVTYVYTVAGRHYSGHDLIAGGLSFGSQEAAEFILAQHPAGSLVSVRYDPDEPSRAVLEPGGGDGWWLWAGGGAASGIVGALLLIRTARDEWLRAAYVRAERMQSTP